MEVLWTVLPFLAFLACPLMMVFCVVGMRKAACGTSRVPQSPAEIGTPEERTAALQQQLRAIQAELAALQTTESPTFAGDATARDDRPAGALLGSAHAVQRPA